MKKQPMQEKTSRSTVIVCGLCAVFWIIRIIFNVDYQTYNDFWFILDVLGAVVWISAFILNLKRFYSDKCRAVFWTALFIVAFIGLVVTFIYKKRYSTCQRL